MRCFAPLQSLNTRQPITDQYVPYPTTRVLSILPPLSNDVPRGEHSVPSSCMVLWPRST
jgi:hypothetical protein